MRVAAGVVASALCGVFSLDPKITGLIASICVACAALFLPKKKPQRADYVVAGFNGFLIYLTLVGATSFYPYVNKRTAAEVGPGKAKASAFSPWVRDPNLVQANQNLAEISRAQAKAVTDVDANVAALERKVQTLNIPPAVRKEIDTGFAASKNVVLTVRTSNAPRIKTLDRLGIRP